MKTEKNILIAFILNFTFAIFEFLGGIYTGSVAIISDAVHDIGDAASIGLSFFLERRSKKQPDAMFTYGYARYSLLGSVITTCILLFGSVLVIYNAINKIITPTEIKYNEMICFAILGVCVNFFAAISTRGNDSRNQKAVNLHMLEDVLGWTVILIGAVSMKFTGFVFIDPLLSIAVAVFILINAVKNLKETTDIFLEKTPHGIVVNEIMEHIRAIDEVMDVHHVHIWSMDGQNNYATMHIVTNAASPEIKHKIKEELYKHGICHVTLEFENEEESCHEKNCRTFFKESKGHHHHHHN